MFNFNYHQPKSISECIDIYNSTELPKYIAGGMTIIPSLKQKLSNPSDLIDLQQLKELKGINRENNQIVIGSLSTHNEVANSILIKDNIIGLSKLASNIADNAIRNLGTIGGSIVNSDPAADYPAALLSLGATIHTNKRSIKAEDFFTDMFETILDHNEIVISVGFPITDSTMYLKFSSQASKYAIVGVFATCNNKKFKFSITGAANKVFLIKELDELGIEELKEFSFENLKLEGYNINSDINASSEYRIALIKNFLKKIISNF